MVNTMYAVFARHITEIAPSVSFRSFIDDAKMWTCEQSVDDLARALSAAEDFDDEIGQVANPAKTSVVTKCKRKATQFLKKVGKRFQVKTNVKSLGFSHSSRATGGAAAQNARASAACTMLRKIKQLPLGRRRKAVYVHSTAHSKWVYGSEIQAPSSRMLHNIRSSVVAVLFKKNRVRCPFLALATYRDAFIDPFGKWVLHCFSKLRSRRIARRLPSLASSVMQQAKALAVVGGLKNSNNGVVAVFAFLCQELGFCIIDPYTFCLESHSGNRLNIVEGSNQNFRDFLENAVRRYLLRRAAKRHDCDVDDSIPDIDTFLTRFLSDSDFRSESDFKFLQPFLHRLPKDRRYTKAIIEALHSGAIYTGPRLKAAGLCHTDSCICGDIPENHQHLFQQCPAYEETRPVRGTEHALSWSTGVFLVPPELEEMRRNGHSLTQFPAHQDRVQVEGAVFVDGSAYHEQWRVLRVSAAAIVAPGVFERSCVLPGNDHTSQRAELYAAVWALKATTGPVTIASDCATVVNRALALKNHLYDCAETINFDNHDLWQLFIEEVLREGVREVSFIKVKAHVGNAYAGQPEWLSKGNERADELAKATAKGQFLCRLQVAQPFLRRAVDIQSHLVCTLVLRKEKRFMVSDPFDECTEPFQALRISATCCCPPKTRIRSKTSASCCQLGSCHQAGLGGSLVLGKLERDFQQAVRDQIVPPRLSERMWAIHLSFKSSLEFVGFLSAPVVPQDCDGIRLRGCYVSAELRNAMSDFICDGRWKWGTKKTDERVSWVVLCAEFTANFGLFTGFINNQMSLGIALRRFRDLFLAVCTRHGIATDVVSGLRHAKTLGFQSLGGVSVARKCKHPLTILSWCLSISQQMHSLQSKTRIKPFSRITPAWADLVASSRSD